VTLVCFKWDGDTTGVEYAGPAFKPEIDIVLKFSADKALEALEEADLKMQQSSILSEEKDRVAVSSRKVGRTIEIRAVM
jgi:hypothetical protein